LLARIGAEPVLQRSTGETPVPPGQSTGETPVPPRRIRFSRQRVLMAAGSLALVALIALSIVYTRSTPREIAREELSGDVASWLVSLPAKKWRPSAALPIGVEVDEAVAAQPRQWQSLP